MRLAYRHAGGGGRPVLLLHGLGSSSAELAAHVDLLAARGWHVVAPDLRGHGESEKPDDESDYDLGALAADVLDLAHDLGWRAFSVVGHEVGGVIAQELAVSAPHWVDGLVVQSSAPGPFPFDRNLAEGGIELVRGTASMAPLAQVHRELGDDNRDGFLDRLLTCAPAAYAAILRQLLDGPDRSPRLVEVRCPTLVIVGEDDLGFVDAARDLVAVIPRAELGVVPGGGHLPHLERPEEWAVTVGGFLQASLV